MLGIPEEIMTDYKAQCDQIDAEVRDVIVRHIREGKADYITEAVVKYALVNALAAATCLFARSHGGLIDDMNQMVDVYRTTTANKYAARQP